MPTSSPNSKPLTRLAAMQPMPFEIHPKIDGRRYLNREFDPDLPLISKLYSFPRYRSMVGENWLHWHDYYELILPVAGSGVFSMGGGQVSFEPGDLLTVDTLRLHGVSALSGPHRSLVVLFPAGFIVGVGALLGDSVFLDPLRSRSPTTPPILKRTHPSAPKVHDALLALHVACNAESSPLTRYTACKVHLLTVLHLLREALGVQKHDARTAVREEANRVRLKRVFKLLAERFTEPLSVSEAAATAGMSSTVFRDFFKHTTGQTLVSYLRQMRLAHAAQRLRDSDESIADIAAASGFCDQSYLHRCFTRQYHCAPLQYRQKNREETTDRLSKNADVKYKSMRKPI